MLIQLDTQTRLNEIEEKLEYLLEELKKLKLYVEANISA